jgi:hypothetical protein
MSWNIKIQSVIREILIVIETQEIYIRSSENQMILRDSVCFLFTI